MSQVSGNIQVQEQVEAKSFIKEPSMYLVRILNDNYTEFDFVVAVLMGVFGHSGMSAVGIATETHERGSAIVGRYTKEIAETKSDAATRLARSENFPLMFSIEPEPDASHTPGRKP